VLDTERHGLERFLTSGIEPAMHAAIGDLPRGRGILGLLIEEPQPIVLSDVGAHPRSYGFPAGHPPMTTFLGVPLLIRGEAWGNLYLTEKEGGGEFGDADQHAVGVLADWAAIAVDHAHLFRESVERAAELEHAVEGLQATTAIARALGSEIDLDRVLELIVKRGRALVRARSVVLLLQEGDPLVTAAGAGQLGAGTLDASLPASESVAGEVLRSGRPERIADVSVRLGLHDEQLAIAGAETALLVPLRYRGRALGVLCAFDRLDEEPEFGDRDEDLLLSFAASAATAVATAQSVEAERLRHSLRSAEQERSRWARELHDETLQGLAGFGLAGMRERAALMARPARGRVAFAAQRRVRDRRARPRRAARRRPVVVRLHGRQGRPLEQRLAARLGGRLRHRRAARPGRGAVALLRPLLRPPHCREPRDEHSTRRRAGGRQTGRAGRRQGRGPKMLHKSDAGAVRTGVRVRRPSSAPPAKCSTRRLALSLLVLVAVGARHHEPAEAALLLGLLGPALATGRWLLRDFRSHPANFPDATASQGLRMAAADAGGRRARSRWASQDRTGGGP
jgi:GAF domain-containing protein